MCLYTLFFLRSLLEFGLQHLSRVIFTRFYNATNQSSPFILIATTPCRPLAFTSFYLKWRGAAAAGIFVAFCNDFKRRSLSSSYMVFVCALLYTSPLFLSHNSKWRCNFGLPTSLWHLFFPLRGRRRLVLCCVDFGNAALIPPLWWSCFGLLERQLVMFSHFITIEM